MKKFIKILCILIFIFTISTSNCKASDNISSDKFLYIPIQKTYNRNIKNIIEEYNKSPYYNNFNKINKLINKDPKNTDLLIIRAFMYLGIHDFIAASNDFDKIIAINPNIDLAYYGKALSCIQYTNPTELFKLQFLYNLIINDLGIEYCLEHFSTDLNQNVLFKLQKSSIDLKTAQYNLDKAIKINNKNPNYFFFRAYINNLYYAGSSNWSKEYCIKDLKTALKLEPKLIEAYGIYPSESQYLNLILPDNINNITEIEDQKINIFLEKYQSDLLNSIKEKPDYIYPYIWLLNYYKDLIDYDAGKEKILKTSILKYISIIKNIDNNPEIYYTETKFNKSEKIYQKFIKSLPFESASAYLELLNIQEEKEYNEDTLKLADKIIELSVSNSDKNAAYIRRAEIKYALKDYTGALCDYQKALTYSNDYSTHSCIAEIQEYLGDKYGALDSYNYIINNFQFKDNITYKMIILYKRGVLKNKLNKYKEALNDFSTAIRISDINNYDFINRVSDSILLARWNDRKELLADIYFDRALLYDKFSNYKMVISDYSSCIKYSPDNANAYYNRALQYEKIHNKKQAIEDFKKARDIYLNAQQINDYKDCLEQINYLSK